MTAVPLFMEPQRADGDVSTSNNKSAQYPIPTKLHDRFPHAFLVRVTDPAMNRVLPAGCYALVNPGQEIDQPGQPYAIAADNTHIVIRRVFPLQNGLELVPYSTDSTIKTQIIDYGNVNEKSVRIIGRIVWCAFPLNWRFEFNA
jgi:repressor LexA